MPNNDNFSINVDEHQALLPQTITQQQSWSEWLKSWGKWVADGTDKSIELTRSLSALLVDNYWVSAYFQFVTASLNELQAIYSCMVFTGLIDCDKNGEARDELYSIIYFVMFAVFFIVNFPSVFYEQWRKTLKSMYYYAHGTNKALYLASGSLLKKFNGGIQVLTFSMAGWNLGTMVAGATSGAFPPATHPAHLSCVQKGWQHLVNHKGKALTYGIIGMLVTAILGGPEMMTYFGRQKPLYGPRLTALSYSLISITLTCFPMLRSLIKNPASMNISDLAIKICAAVIVTYSRYRTYETSNGVTIVMKDGVGSPEIRAKNKQIEALKKQIITLKANLQTVKNDRYNSRSKALRQTIQKCTQELKKLETEVERAQIVLDNWQVNQSDLNELNSKPTYKKLFDFFTMMFGGIGLGYLTTVSLLAMFIALGWTEEDPPTWMLALVNFLSVSATLPRYLRSLVGAFGVVKLTDADFKKTVDEHLSNADRAASELAADWPKKDAMQDSMA